MCLGFCIILCFIGCNLAYNVTQRTEIRKIYTFYLLTFFTFFLQERRERIEGNIIFYTHILTMGILTHWRLLQMSCLLYNGTK